MKFTKAAILALTVGSTAAFAPLVTRPQQQIASHLQQSTSTAEEAEKKAATKKEDRLRMMQSPRFHRRGFKEVRDGAEQRLQQEYMSEVVKELKESNYVMEKDGVKVYLAKVRI